jgi:hypothetical protein
MLLVLLLVINKSFAPERISTAACEHLTYVTSETFLRFKTKHLATLLRSGIYFSAMGMEIRYANATLNCMPWNSTHTGKNTVNLLTKILAKDHL